MSVNFSSTSDGLLDYLCPTIGFDIYTAILTLRVILLLPLSIFILYLGHQQWKQWRSFKAAAHSDIFTYHMAVMELIGVLGFIGYIYGSNTNQLVVRVIGLFGSFIPFFGGTYFQILTCVERYLAVVHPITYRGLRNARGVTIRNISTGCAWLFSFGMVILSYTLPNEGHITVSYFLGFSMVLVTFCSFTVLRVLRRPGPGEAGVEKDQVDQIKLRAFYTIIAILGVVCLWFSVFLICSVLSPLLNDTVQCVMGMSVCIANLPCSFVLPLLYLHKEGKLSCCFSNCKRRLNKHLKQLHNIFV